MELVRDLIASQEFSAVGFVFKATVDLSGEKQKAVLLVTSLRENKETTLYIRPIRDDGTLADAMTEKNPSGRLTNLWK